MSGRRKHLILVHGRATKPAFKEKLRLARTALLHGIERTAPEAAQKIKSGEVKFTLAYFGDVNNRILRRAGESAWKWMKAKDPDHENAFCESGELYEESLAKTLSRPNSAFTKKDYKAWLREVEDLRGLDDFARVASGLASMLGLSDELIRKTAPDMCAYLTQRTYASEIRTRLQEPLKKALMAGDDICLLAHSMGCIIAYDVLWKFSRMSEYRELRGRKVDVWLTIGNPLGEPGVQENLYDAHEGRDGQYPKDIIDTWINLTAHDDFIAHDGSIADDFREMKKRRFLRRIVDRPKIYTFWEGFSGANPHKLYAYLDHPKVGAEIARWVARPDLDSA